jgi:hypothetical protein
VRAAAVDAANNVHDGPRRVPRAVLERDGDHISLSHLDTAAYLHAKNLPISDAWRVGNYRYKFVFYDPDHLAEGFAIEFINSFCADYADSVKRLKSVVHQFAGQSERGRRNEKAARRDRSGYSG